MNTTSATEQDRFYRERDSRTVGYLDREPLFSEPVTVHAAEDASVTQAGQLTLLTLVNQLVRFHRVVRVVCSNPEVGLLTPAVAGARTLGEELANLAAAIDPYGQFELDTCPGASWGTVSIGLGKHCPRDLDWYVGCDRSVGSLTSEPSSVGRGSSADLRGASAAAVLGASAVTKAVLGLRVVPCRLSAWNFEQDDAADPGPVELPVVDVGRVLMVGAGAVACSVAYWLMQWGYEGSWTVVDADRVKIHNTNRCVLFFPGDAGRLDGQPRFKSRCLARYLPGMRPVEKWYDEATEIQEQVFDTVLLLANDREVRTWVSHRNDPIQLQATTGPTWLAQLHRHVLPLDDCPVCRMEEVGVPAFSCSEVSLATKKRPRAPDAALPFLSLASGLMLVAALQSLQLGEFGTSEENRWNWDFKSAHQMAHKGIRRCEPSCPNRRLAPSVVRDITSGTRWRGRPWFQ